MMYADQLLFNASLLRAGDATPGEQKQICARLLQIAVAIRLMETTLNSVVQEEREKEILRYDAPHLIILGEH